MNGLSKVTDPVKELHHPSYMECVGAGTWTSMVYKMDLSIVGLVRLDQLNEMWNILVICILLQPLVLKRDPEPYGHGMPMSLVIEAPN